jgi:hypothetical protein
MPEKPAWRLAIELYALVAIKTGNLSSDKPLKKE